MNKTILFDFIVDKESKEIKVKRSFNAPIDMVWSAWTEAEILDQWWAPKPWVAKTKSMHFKEGGYWLYAMVGPENEEHWARVDYNTIHYQEYFSAYDGFCDADGNLNPAFPRNKWENRFIEQNNQTMVNILLTFDALKDLEKIISMGFKEGFTSGLKNLDQYLEAQIKIK